MRRRIWSHRVVVAVACGICIAMAIVLLCVAAIACRRPLCNEEKQDQQQVSYWPAHGCFYIQSLITLPFPFPYPFLTYSLLTYQYSGSNICNVCQTDLKRALSYTIPVLIPLPQGWIMHWPFLVELLFGNIRLLSDYSCLCQYRIRSTSQERTSTSQFFLVLYPLISHYFYLYYRSNTTNSL